MNRSSHRCFESNINIFMAILGIAIILILQQGAATSKAKEEVLVYDNDPCTATPCNRTEDCYSACSQKAKGWVPWGCFSFKKQDPPMCCCQPPV
ncbi:unnamed protein product [Cuscuta epithymum]|uniref:Uncharacterized protein n=1 Tax=Cuscuta epithymum TaxID=186058 RepID=A0AAV0CW11_9ASTE|nr:unnamed protein product [Cuscuta epithymum]